MLRGIDRRGPVRAADQRGVQRNAPRGQVDVQLHRIVARLAMDIDRAGEGRGLVVGKPLVIGLPTVGRGDENHLAAAGMVQPVAAALRRRPAPRRCPAGRGRSRPPARSSADRRRPRRRARTGDRPGPRPGWRPGRDARRRPARGRSAARPRGARGWDRRRDRPA